jgi:hypothetical protein
MERSTLQVSRSENPSLKERTRGIDGTAVDAAARAARAAVAS